MLPVGLKALGQFQGGRGPKGATGTFASASAVALPAESPATVTMSGPEDARHVVFGVPRGLPGLNTVPTDEAVAALLAALDSETGEIARDLFVGGRAVEESATLGPDIADGSGWTLGAGWSGSFADGFTHTSGTAPLTWPVASGSGVWLVEFTVTSPTDSTAFEVTLGGGSAGIIYQGTPSPARYVRAIQSVADGALIFTPESSFDGTISDIVVRALGVPYQAQSTWRDVAGEVSLEARSAGPGNLFLGLNTGQYAVTDADPGARFNTIVGQESGEAIVTGFFNAGVGYRTLRNLVGGSRNAAIGYRALENVVSGDRNVGVGPFAGNALTDGARNVMVGTDVLYQTEHSSDNIGIGYLAMHAADDIHVNIAIGRYAMGSAEGGTQNIALGTAALRLTTGDYNIGIGYQALRDATGNYSIAIGSNALRSSTENNNVAIGTDSAIESTGASLVAIGFRSARYYDGSFNTAIGSGALQGAQGQAGGERNVAIGYNAGSSLQAGDRNVILGSTAGTSLTTGSGNILIGNGVQTTPVASGDDHLNIGNIIRGALSLDSPRMGVGVGASPTARWDIAAGDALTAPLRLRSGPLKTSPFSGDIEYDGTNLYITIGSTRRQIALV